MYMLHSLSSGLLPDKKLTFQLCTCDTVPECQAAVAATGAERALAFVEGDGIDGEYLLGVPYSGSFDGRSHVVPMALERIATSALE